jgi:hypothetical protein
VEDDLGLSSQTNIVYNAAEKPKSRKAERPKFGSAINVGVDRSPKHPASGLKLASLDIGLPLGIEKWRANKTFAVVWTSFV